MYLTYVVFLCLLHFHTNSLSSKITLYKVLSVTIQNCEVIIYDTTTHLSMNLQFYYLLQTTQV